MSNPTSNYSFVMPTSTDLVKDLPADFEVFGQAVDTQMKTNADAAIAKTIVDAKGDLIAATAADTVARLAVGTTGQILTADSSESTGMKWATPASGGITQLATGSMSGSANITISSISQSYKNLILICQDFNQTNENWFGLRFNSVSSNTYSYTWIKAGNSSVSGTYDTNLMRVVETGSTDTNAVAVIEIPLYTATGSQKVASWSASNKYNGIEFGSGAAKGVTDAISSIGILTIDGVAFGAGTYTLYGAS